MKCDNIHILYPCLQSNVPELVGARRIVPVLSLPACAPACRASLGAGKVARRQDRGNGRGVDVPVAMLIKDFDGEFFDYGFGDLRHNIYHPAISGDWFVYIPIFDNRIFHHG